MANKKIALVSCVKTKADKPKPAKELYISPLFRKSSTYAQMVSDEWYILSAKYGLLSPEQVIPPYEKTLKNMGASDRKNWAKRVLRQMTDIVSKGDEIIILAGKDYREYLINPLQNMGCKVSVPMEGLVFGKQLRWLKKNIGNQG